MIIRDLQPCSHAGVAGALSRCNIEGAAASNLCLVLGFISLRLIQAWVVPSLITLCGASPRHQPPPQSQLHLAASEPHEPHPSSSTPAVSCPKQPASEPAPGLCAGQWECLKPVTPAWPGRQRAQEVVTVKCAHSRDGDCLLEAAPCPEQWTTQQGHRLHSTLHNQCHNRSWRFEPRSFPLQPWRPDVPLRPRARFPSPS
jgi:hypothetical protein